jgi:hypothetical protein
MSSTSHRFRMSSSPRVLKRALAACGPLMILAVLFSVGLTRAPAAHAYGNQAQWQIALSFNCDNPAVCGPNLGGFWGWAEFDADNTADAQLTGCGHLQGGRGGGAQHMSVNGTGWTIGPNGDFFLTGEIDTITGHTGGPPVTVVIPTEFFDTGIPAAPGHYSALTLFGMQGPPGTNFEIQVVQLNH